MSGLDLALYLLALIACHRIWHREDIFAYTRSMLAAAGGWTKPLVCPPCSPIWVGVLLAVVWPYLPTWIVWPLAAYPPVRLLVFLYRIDWVAFLPGRAERLQEALDTAVAKRHQAVAPPVKITGGCTECGAAAVAGAARIAPASEPGTVIAAANAEIVVAVPLDAPDATLIGAARTVRYLVDHGLIARLLGIGPTPTAPSAARLTPDALHNAARAAGLDAHDAVVAEGERSLHLADALFVAGPRAGDLQWDAAMHGGLLVVPPGHASVGPQACLVVDPLADTGLAADRIVDLLTRHPTHHARKAVLRSGTASRRPQI